jgi:hypothetical protein
MLWYYLLLLIPLALCKHSDLDEQYNDNIVESKVDKSLSKSVLTYAVADQQLQNQFEIRMKPPAGMVEMPNNCSMHFSE